LAGRIAQRGALISEFPIRMEPSRENFPRRNRVIAGLSLGVVVVEAPVRSGALITAREAMEQGREVFAVPGPVSSTRSKGTHRLLKDGAKLVEDARDVLEELAPQIKGRLDLWRGERPDAAPHDALLLSEEESAVYQAIPIGGGILVGTLAESVVFSPSRLLPILTSLELKGLVRPMPGQGYSRAV
ncbi:MAG: DNA-protecting protein DprA, partial [Candidatus Omnitrophica bacterium]|nr:DNA-protecting protein DprA [Candidatus Omnitrophota bacterium]